jgi:hypothetical protein
MQEEQRNMFQSINQSLLQIYSKSQEREPDSQHTIKDETVKTVDEKRFKSKDPIDFD